MIFYFKGDIYRTCNEQNCKYGLEKSSILSDTLRYGEAKRRAPIKNIEHKAYNHDLTKWCYLLSAGCHDVFDTY